MSRSVGILLLLAVALAFGASSFWLWTYRTRGTADEELGFDPVADFTLVNQDGQTVTRADLAGKVWVASFLFTRCCTSCPQVSANLARLQHELAGQDGVVLVSFSVDPDHDTPAVLKAYAEAHGADSKASYLYYHFVVRHGQPTAFLGEGWIRPVYFAVLLSHTTLAAVVPVLALMTIYRALRSQFVRHVRLARWTLPIWLYVSVTGVAVYWMLYRLYAPG
jgi:hypothetical protein